MTEPAPIGEPSMIRAWLVVVLCSVVMMMGAGPIYYAYGNYAVVFAKEFSAPLTVINIGFMLVGVVGNLGSAPVGTAIDRWGVRLVASVGLIGTAIGLWLVSVASGIWQIVILFGTLIAMADVCIGVVSTSYLVSHWFERRRGLALGLSVLGTSASAIIFPPLTNALIDSYGWRTTFVIYGVMMIALLPPVLLLARLPAKLPAAERFERPGAGNDDRSLTVRTLFASRRFWILSYVIGVMLGANTGTMVSMVAFATDRGFTAAQGSYLISVLGVTAVLGKVLTGIGIDRLNINIVLRMGLICQLAGMVLLAIAASFPMMLGAAAVFGLGVGAMLPVWSAAIAAYFGLAGYGRTLGWSRAVMTPVMLVFPIIAGASFDLTGDYRATWAVFALLVVTALLLVAGLRAEPSKPVSGMQPPIA